jgi:hypothetical protein
MLYILIQVIIAIILVILMGALAYGIYNKNVQELILDIVKPKIIKKKTKILDGLYSYEKGKVKYNTNDKLSGTYIDLSPSINQNGGAVYTYNFWLFMPADSTTCSRKNDLVLFTRGSEKRIKYTSKFTCNTDDTNPINGTTGTTINNKWFLVKNPLVRLNIDTNTTTNTKRIDQIVVEINSIEHPEVVHEGANVNDKSCSDDKNTNENLFGIKNLKDRTDLHNKWNMITIVVSETNPSDDILFKNKSIVKLYLNGYKYLTKHGEAIYNNSKSTAIRSNKGNLYLNPETTSSAIISECSKIAISDLTYFNYTLEDKDIISLFKEGCKKTPALIPSETAFDSLSVKQAELEKTNQKNPKQL